MIKGVDDFVCTTETEAGGIVGAHNEKTIAKDALYHRSLSVLSASLEGIVVCP